MNSSPLVLYSGMVIIWIAGLFDRFDIEPNIFLPTIFLVDDLFLDKLDVPYWDSNSYKYINNNVIEKIKKYDISFVNSQHMNEILKKYDIICKLFYWDFIPYYGKEIINNNNRKYDYSACMDSK